MREFALHVHMPIASDEWILVPLTDHDGSSFGTPTFHTISSMLRSRSIRPVDYRNLLPRDEYHHLWQELQRNPFQ